MKLYMKQAAVRNMNAIETTRLSDDSFSVDKHTGGMIISKHTKSM